jgi:argininosuccinate lyase
MCVRVMHLMVDNLVVHPDRLRQGCASELYATDEVLARLGQGGNFRDTYKEVGLNLATVRDYDAVEVIRNRTSQGTTGDLRLSEYSQQARVLEETCADTLEKLHGVYRALAGCDVSVVAW